MKANDFIQQEMPILAKKLEEYLAQRIAHADIQKHIDKVFESWEHVELHQNEPYATGEKEFWCAVWAAQHLASSDHWADGVAQKELGILQKVFIGKVLLPVGYEGRRP